MSADPRLPAIDVHDLGIQFSKNKRARLRARDAYRRKPREGEGFFWGLRDVTFAIPGGQAVGLVGANGQGKSTLLSLLAGVMVPDEGTITVRGGVAPIIELTGGFKSDLSVGDNLQIVAGLHGMSKTEVAEKFDDIIAFAGLEDFIEIPFRHLSSGMRVRLAFSVLTSLDEPILLVDEVLAVGDRQFKEKCYNRIDQLLVSDRTLLLVSHDENDLRRFCTRGLYLESGRLIADGPIDEVLELYEDDNPTTGRRRRRRKRRSEREALEAAGLQKTEARKALRERRRAEKKIKRLEAQGEEVDPQLRAKAALDVGALAALAAGRGTDDADVLASLSATVTASVTASASASVSASTDRSSAADPTPGPAGESPADSAGPSGLDNGTGRDLDLPPGAVVVTDARRRSTPVGGAPYGLGRRRPVSAGEPGHST